MSGFTLFQDLLGHTNNILASFVNEATSNAIATITPFIVAALNYNIILVFLQSYARPVRYASFSTHN